ncbi:MAG: histidinol dehydrogenase [Gammaproteobacteria bacterium]|nr:histidinol dehydrogenase [Gammaproteobacteria bacterium]MBQ0839709.1 histidinol dehydrogenase [Gammaproteobacteria bacterium]
MSELKPLRLDAGAADFSAHLDQLLAWQPEFADGVAAVVADIIAAVRSEGDKALLEYTCRFDRREVGAIEQLEVGSAALQQALVELPAEQRQALEIAAERILRYHQHQRQESWQYSEADGTVLGQKITPMQRVGIYVPGGKASYPSSVLMNALPAKVAGVDEIIMVVPAPDGELNPAVLAAAAIAGVDRVFTVGGAQAVAALAYGTQSIPKVDKVVGPGNIYVATAKKAVFGEVGLDMVAGPSEILVICDGLTEPDWIAMDLFSQAEHDEQAQAILISPDADFLQAVLASMEKLLAEMPRREIIKASINGRAALIKVADLDEAARIANRIAPEHLELSVADPEAMLADIRHAGAIFMGRHTPEALGDYCAGPNHVLPTSTTARFSSPLGVYDFQKRTSLIACSAEGAAKLADTAAVLARCESLEAHARSADYRR